MVTVPDTTSGNVLSLPNYAESWLLDCFSVPLPEGSLGSMHNLSCIRSKSFVQRECLAAVLREVSSERSEGNGVACHVARHHAGKPSLASYLWQGCVRSGLPRWPGLLWLWQQYPLGCLPLRGSLRRWFQSVCLCRGFRWFQSGGCGRMGGQLPDQPLSLLQLQQALQSGCRGCGSPLQSGCRR